MRGEDNCVCPCPGKQEGASQLPMVLLPLLTQCHRQLPTQPCFLSTLVLLSLDKNNFVGVGKGPGCLG